jgi:hypothetical protein
MNGEPQPEPRGTAVLVFASRAARRILPYTGGMLTGWALAALTGTGVAQAAPINPSSITTHHVVGTAPAPASTRGADASTPDNADTPVHASLGMRVLTARPVSGVGRAGAPVVRTVADPAVHVPAANAQVTGRPSLAQPPATEAFPPVAGTLTSPLSSPQVPFHGAEVLGDPPAEMATPDAVVTAGGHSAPAGEAPAGSGSPAAAGPRARPERADLAGGRLAATAGDPASTPAASAPGTAAPDTTRATTSPTTSPLPATPATAPGPVPSARRGGAPAGVSGSPQAHSVGECSTPPVGRCALRPIRQVARSPVPPVPVRDHAGQPTTSPD